VHEFSYNTTIAIKKISPTLARSKSNIMPATQPTDTRQRKNTDKAAEALHYLVKLSLLGQRVVETKMKKQWKEILKQP